MDNSNGTLLVIGNGFDLTLGANTSYSDYFNSEVFKDSKELIHQFVNMDGGFGEIEDKREIEFNCWELLFYLESVDKSLPQVTVNENVRWCDIEKVIYDSLRSCVNRLSMWSHIFELVKNHFSNQIYMWKRNLFSSSDNDIVKLITCFLCNTLTKEHVDNEEVFFEWLLKQLNDFELKFGLFINEAIEKCEDYYLNAKTCIKNLANAAEVVGVDSFNYSGFEGANIRHINGNVDNPIFGIESLDDVDNDSSGFYLFTKTSRRVFQDVYNLNMQNNWDNHFINRAIVFGHSLNEMDYGYFSYLFTRLSFNTFNVEKMGNVEFVFRVYDENKSNTIKEDYAKAVYDLINYYESYVSKTDQHVLLNLLRFSGKLRIREVTKQDLLNEIR